MCLGSQALSHAAKNGLYLMKGLGAFPYLQIPCICTTEPSQKQEQKLEKSISHILKSETLEEHRKDSGGKSHGVLEGGRKIKRWETGTLKNNQMTGGGGTCLIVEASLLYRVSSRTARDTQRNPVSEKKKDKAEQTKRKKSFKPDQLQRHQRL